MHSSRLPSVLAAAISAVLLLAACGPSTPERTVVSGSLSLTSVQGPDPLAADDPMLAVLGQTTRLTLRTAAFASWDVNTFEWSGAPPAHLWQRLWTYSSPVARERPDFEPDASGYLQVVVEPAMVGQATSLSAVRHAEASGIVEFSATLSGAGFRLTLSCPSDAMRLDADGFPLAPSGLVLPCTAMLCRATPALCLQGPGLFEFDLPPASLPATQSAP